MARPTEEEVNNYVKLVDEKRELDRKSRLIESQIKPLKEKIFDHVYASAKGCMKLFGWLFKICSRAGRVGWKDEYIKKCGIDAASKLQDKVDKEEYLHHEPTNGE